MLGVERQRCWFQVSTLDGRRLHSIEGEEPLNSVAATPEVYNSSRDDGFTSECGGQIGARGCRYCIDVLCGSGRGDFCHICPPTL